MVLPESEDETPPEPSALNILLIGDPKVGKTSLINTLIRDEFNPNLPARLENVTLSAKVTPEKVPLKIVDYSERENTLDDYYQFIRESDVICIVYSAIDQGAVQRIKVNQIPTIRQVLPIGDSGKYKPIIVAANKTDLLNDVNPTFRAPFQEFEDVEAVIDVSALTKKNVVELFYLAQKAVLFPVAPLFDSQSRTLTKKCRSALIDIFKLCDLDGDSLISDHELNLFHENCFGTPLQKDALDDLKSIIKQSTMDGISENSITQSGFLFLHAFSIDKGRHAFTWRVLKKFNYDNQINIKSEPKNSTEKMENNFATQFSASLSSSSSIQKNGEYNQLDLGILKEEEENSSIFRLLHSSVIQENSKLIRAGFGLAVATFVSMLALKYLVQGGSKGLN